MSDVGDVLDAVSRTAQNAVNRAMTAGRDACETFNGIVDGSMSATDAVGLVVTEVGNRIGLNLRQHTVTDGITFLLPFAAAVLGFKLGRLRRAR